MPRPSADAESPRVPSPDRRDCSARGGQTPSCARLLESTSHRLPPKCAPENQRTLPYTQTVALPCCLLVVYLQSRSVIRVYSTTTPLLLSNPPAFRQALDTPFDQ